MQIVNPPCNGQFGYADMSTVATHAGSGCTVTVNSPLTMNNQLMLGGQMISDITATMQGSITESGSWGSYTYNFPDTFNPGSGNYASLSLNDGIFDPDTQTFTETVYLMGPSGTHYHGSYFTFATQVVAIEGLTVTDDNSSNEQATGTQGTTGHLTYVPDADGYIDFDLTAVLSQLPAGTTSPGQWMHWRAYQSSSTGDTTLEQGVFAAGDPTAHVHAQATDPNSPVKVELWFDFDDDNVEDSCEEYCSLKDEAAPAWTIHRGNGSRAGVDAAKGASDPATRRHHRPQHDQQPVEELAHSPER